MSGPATRKSQRQMTLTSQLHNSLEMELDGDSNSKRKASPSEMHDESPGAKEPRTRSSEILSDLLIEFRKFNLRFEAESQKADKRHEELLQKLTCFQAPQTSSQEPQTEQEVTRLLRLHEKTWRDNLKKRGSTFRKLWMNQEKAVIMGEYLQREPPFIMNKCKEKPIKGQTSDSWMELQKVQLLLLH